MCHYYTHPNRYGKMSSSSWTSLYDISNWIVSASSLIIFLFSEPVKTIILKYIDVQCCIKECLWCTNIACSEIGINKTILGYKPAIVIITTVQWLCREYTQNYLPHFRCSCTPSVTIIVSEIQFTIKSWLDAQQVWLPCYRIFYYTAYKTGSPWNNKRIASFFISWAPAWSP